MWAKIKHTACQFQKALCLGWSKVTGRKANEIGMSPIFKRCQSGFGNVHRTGDKTQRG
jgi:hypothetical protein